MSGIPDLRSPAPNRLMGIVGSWLQARWREVRPSFDAPEGEPEGRAPLVPGSVRVLVVDDDPVNLRLISVLMESQGLVPLLAADGAEAVALACELHFDLILMDLQMPILDGLGAKSAIRRHESHSLRPPVPVVAYSSAPPGAGVLARHGLNGSLAKPCGAQELEDRLVRWCPAYRPVRAVRGVVPGRVPGQAGPQAAFGSSGTASLR